MMLHICCAPCLVAIVDKLINIPEIELSGFSTIQTYILRRNILNTREAVNKMASDYGIPGTLFRMNQGLEYWKNNLSRKRSQVSDMLFIKA